MVKNSIRESKVEPEKNFFVYDWMISELNLKGNELIVYAIIFGFSQEKTKTFRESLRYLMDWTLCSKQGVINILKSLIKKDYIKKIEHFNNRVKSCEYYVTKGEKYGTI